MGKMCTRIASFIILQFLSLKISPSDGQGSLSQYLQLAGFAPQPPPPTTLGPTSYPNPSYTASPNYQPSIYHTPSKPNSLPPSPLPLPLSAITSLAASVPPTKSLPHKAPTVPKASDKLPSSGLDSDVLNNLAIALQLLIVSNILNTPILEPPEPLSMLEIPSYDFPISPMTLSYPVQSAITSLPPSYLESTRPKHIYTYDSLTLPNANFLGSSGYTDSVFRPPSHKPNPRSSMTLMSPYEALGPNSPFSDPILSSPYSTGYSKKDFQNPYASLLAADSFKDLFSVADFY